MNLRQWAGGLAFYGGAAALIGYFSAEPRYAPVPEGQGLLRVSIVHATQRRDACRERSAAELAKLPPNMRAAQDCPRERSPMLVEVEVDGRLVLRREAQPSGLRRDGNAALYERLVLPAGTHRVAARLRDRPGEGFDHAREDTVALRPGQALLLDFNAAHGGFHFRD